MKEMKMAILAIIAILSFSLLIMGCPDGSTDNKNPGTEPEGDYKNLKLNEVSGVGDDTKKFYELINIGTKDIPLEGCTIYYNANSATGGTLPTGDGTPTWTGSSTQTALAGKLFSLIGRDNPDGSTTSPGSFTTGLTAQRILIITLKDPDGKVIDKCVRAADTGAYTITDKSFSRIPDGTGDFYFTTPTPNATNGTSTAGLTKVPVEPVVTQPSAQLMILQVFGMHLPNDSAPTHSFIELYNNTNAAISLTSYSVHWANGQSTNANAPAEQEWHRINLTGSIPAKGSYLILGAQLVDDAEIANSSSTNGRLDLTKTAADLTSPTFKMSNRSYKVALMSNQSDITVANPWGNPAYPACIDLVSAINNASTDSVNAAKGEADLTAVNAASGGAHTISKQKSWRRTSLAVSTVTLTDFTSKAYNSLSDADIDKFRPRNSAAGPYTPQF